MLMMRSRSNGTAFASRRAVTHLLLVFAVACRRTEPPRCASAASLHRNYEPDGRRRRLQQQLDSNGDENDIEKAAAPYKPFGDASCPCLPADELKLLLTPDGESTFRGTDINLTSFGAGCAPHDLNTADCSNPNDCANISPLPPDCERSYCHRSWCYVDGRNCVLTNTASKSFYGRHYSYATCGYMDSFTHTERLSALRGRALRVAYNSNSGGWRGAYNRDGSFAVNDQWKGPIVNFVQNAALRGGFVMNVTRPPAWLREESENFFGSSSFDYCVYAVSLGYLDMCVADYTITNKRASVTAFFETIADPIYLITFEEDDSTTWDTFVQAFLTIFQPFTLGSWLMIIFFCLPVLGLLMLFHEYGSPGSAYPRTIPSVLKNLRTGQREYKTKKVSMWKHIIRSVYMSFLAFVQEAYDQSVVTTGGKVNLLAISLFILMVIAVYTANLAAILTSDISRSSVSSIDDALKSGYNFCSERKVAEMVMGVHGIDPKWIVPDPTSLGGDGQPGFNCIGCVARTRVFEYMRVTHDDTSTYCNAAFASWEDLQVLYSRGQHCDKAKVGEPLAHQNIGIPLHGGVSDALVSLFHQVQNEGVMETSLSVAEPASVCPVTEGEGNALTIKQLTGIWVITFSFACAALLVKLINHCQVKRTMSTKEKVEEPLLLYDQWGNPTDHEIYVDGRTFLPDDVRELQRTLDRWSARNMSYRGPSEGGARGRRRQSYSSAAESLIVATQRKRCSEEPCGDRRDVMKVLQAGRGLKPRSSSHQGSNLEIRSGSPPPCDNEQSSQNGTTAGDTDV